MNSLQTQLRTTMYLKASVVILLCAPLSVLCSASTTLQIHRSGGYNLTAGGVSEAAITTRARFLFNITDVNLRNGVQALTGARPPDRVYLTIDELESPSITSGGWNQTWVQLLPCHQTLRNISLTTSTMDTMYYNNNGTTALNVATTFNPTVANKYSHIWQTAIFPNHHLLSFYTVWDDNGSITYGNSWGINRVDAFHRTLQHNIFTAHVPAGGAVRANLLRHTNTVELTLLYRLALSGDVLAHWNDGDRYETFDVNRVLMAAGLNTEHTDEEIVQYALINEAWAQ